jgi:HEAT repeat protein
MAPRIESTDDDAMTAISVPPLVANLKDKNELVRIEAAQALARLGPAALDARPALIEALKVKNELIIKVVVKG